MRPPDFDEALMQTEELLRKSEEQFRLLVEGVKEYAIFMLDPEGHVSTWNLGAERTKGYDAAEILGKHFSIFYPREDIERRHPEHELRVAAEKGTYEEQGIRLRKDGSTFWADVVITALRDEAGNLRGFAKVTRDITARKEAGERERMLAQEQAAREQATNILESISDAFFAIDHEWRFTYVNRKAEDRWGRSREEFLGKDLREEYPQAEDSEFYRQLRLAMESGVATEFETISLMFGTWIAGRACPSQEGLSVYFRDISERKRAEGEIRRSEQRYRSFVEQSTEAIWRFELEEPIPTNLPEDEQIERFYRHAYLAECNDALARMYGFGWADDIVGARLEDFLPRSIPENEAYLRAFVHSGHRLTDAESEEVDREGNPKRFLNNLTGIEENGFLVRAWGTQRDVTERRRAEEAHRFMAEASDMLSSSLDYRQTLSSVARLAVPRLADWCVVDVLGEDGSLERLAVEHSDPGKVALAYELQERYPPDPDNPRGVHQVLRTGEREMMAEIPDELLEAAAVDAEHREILRDLGLRSYMVVPLVARARTLGAITLVASESGRRYGQADLELAQELARRAALAVDNSRLYEEAQREIAERKRAEESLRRVREIERNRIARDLHDDVLQDLTYCAASMGLMVLQAEDPKRKEQLQTAVDAVRRACQGLRDAVNDLSREDEKDRPFPELVESLVERNRAMAEGAYEIRLKMGEGVPPVPLGEPGTQAFRILQEALTNARRHSGAKIVTVGVDTEGGDLVAEVSDDGRGFGPETAAGVGRSSMRERANAVGGELEIASQPGQGTRVRLRVPLPQGVQG